MDLDGNVIKNELYKYFKSMNDRWVAGQDFKSVTIFEDFLFILKLNVLIFCILVIKIPNCNLCEIVRNFCLVNSL